MLKDKCEMGADHVLKMIRKTWSVPIFIKHILLDFPRKSDTQRLTFDWRRNSQKEPALDQNGQVIMIPQPPPHPPKVKKKFYLVTHNIDVPLVHQKP